MASKLANYIKLDKITLASWVEKALDLSLTKKNILLGVVRITRIWPLNPTTMHEKTNLNNLYTINNTTTNNRQGEDGDFTSNEENKKFEKEDNNIQWEE